MAQDNGYAFVEVQEDGTKTICIDFWFEAQPGHGMSFDTRPKTDREAMWVHCQMHRSRMGHTTTNRGLVATGTSSLVVGQGLRRGNTTIPVRGDYLIGLGVRSTTVAGLAGGSVATRSITVLEVIDDCMSLQRTDSGEDETEPPATHGTRSLTSNQIIKVDIPVGLFVNHIRSLFECDFVSLDSRLQLKKSAMDSSFTLGSTEEVNNVKILQSCKDDIGSSEFTIHEIMKGCSVWTVRYRVDTDDFMTPLPEGWSIWSTYWSIVLGEREEDSFLVINLSRKIDYVRSFRPKAQFITGGGLFVGTRRVVEVDLVLGVVGAKCFDLDLSFSGFVIAAFLEVDLELDPCFPSKAFFYAWLDLDPSLPLEVFSCSQVELKLQVSSELDFKGLLGFESEESELHKRMRFWFVQEIAEEEGFLNFLRDRCDDLRRRGARRQTDKLAALTEVLVETQAGIHEKEGQVAKMELND
ncbi:hypothetical protein Tco_0108924 [Tanacetum coccineum]